MKSTIKYEGVFLRNFFRMKYFKMKEDAGKEPTKDERASYDKLHSVMTDSSKS